MQTYKTGLSKIGAITDFVKGGQREIFVRCTVAVININSMKTTLYLYKFL